MLYDHKDMIILLIILNKSQLIFTLFSIDYSNQPIKLRHRASFDGIHDVNVGLHGLVVRMAGPFHDDVGSDAHGEGVNDEGAATFYLTSKGFAFCPTFL